ncbi:hypothetical protein NC651_020984 [Populus alba x Populus x berolinensis]|nr:hypothetical protein NC651_020984 [Populus alba x Populus x berolinensis]
MEWINEGETPIPAEKKRLSTWGIDALDDVVLDLKHLTEDLKHLFSMEDERRKEGKDERKRKYTVTVDEEIEAYRMKKIHRDDPVTVEEIEAYRMKKIHRNDPVKDFLH